ncbi:hypothetical protein E8D34_04980 [Nocardioides sp. GY 10113]|uniref:hypothetical protein n=1 Tax=Nocardioides sp. GY 10113 TaxID=2569761 RepID=UPI0010A904F7|nr:hypothetical protein [Nocardioides sp. GY 10113]TIC88296.1 hypothetical protein E8D34_04980 [Nocardioides sp. GY 10113]
MPGPLLHLGATVTCAHAGPAAPTMTNPRVTVSGQPTALLTAPYRVTGCALPPPPTANGPCVTGQWTLGTTRVTSTGQPLAILGGTALCAPTGTPLLTLAAQLRATAS